MNSSSISKSISKQIAIKNIKYTVICFNIDTDINVKQLLIDMSNNTDHINIIELETKNISAFKIKLNDIDSASSIMKIFLNIVLPIINLKMYFSDRITLMRNV